MPTLNTHIQLRKSNTKQKIYTLNKIKTLNVVKIGARETLVAAEAVALPHGAET